MADNNDGGQESLKKEHYFKETIKFEDIIEDIGSNGKFQIRMNLIFNFMTIIFSAMSGYGTLLALTVPEHWCHVPGRENTSMSIEMWKDLTIPRTGAKYSSCTMKVSGQENVTTDCAHGWDYDDTWFSETAVTQQNWVCDDKMRPITVLSISRFVSIPFGVVLFFTGDRFGRRKQFLFSLSLIAIARSLLTASAPVFPLYVALAAAAEGPGMPCTESTVTVGIELAGIRHRSLVNFFASSSYCLGSIGIGLLAWHLRNWIHFILVASVPCFIPLLLHGLLPESPRWLLSRGRPEEALKVLQRIAKVNGRTLPTDITTKLNVLCQQRTPNAGITNLLTNRTLFRNTMLLVCSRSAATLLIFTLLLNSKSFGQNPFIAYIALGILKFFAAYLVHFIGNKIGRRITHCIILLVGTAACLALVLLSAVPSPRWMSTVVSLILQFCGSSSLSLTNLQSIEIHPTCLRQIAIAVEYVVVQCVMCSLPYLANLGHTSGLHYMFGILAAVLFSTAILMSFMPESLHEKLPETMKDAALYGCDQKYWSLARKPSMLESATLYKYEFKD